MKFEHSKYQKGFTLIELLVVISIIGMLSSVVLASVAQARVKGKDAARMNQIHQIDLAIQLYISTNGTAPTLGGACAVSITLNSSTVSSCVPKSSATGAQGTAWSTFKSELAPYMKSVPGDMCGTNCQNNLGYVYVAPAAMKTYVDPSGATSFSYQLYAPLEGRAVSTGVSTFGSFFSPSAPTGSF